MKLFLLVLVLAKDPVGHLGAATTKSSRETDTTIPSDGNGIDTNGGSVQTGVGTTEVNNATDQPGTNQTIATADLTSATGGTDQSNNMTRKIDSMNETVTMEIDNDQNGTMTTNIDRLNETITTENGTDQNGTITTNIDSMNETVTTDFDTDQNSTMATNIDQLNETVTTDFDTDQNGTMTTIIDRFNETVTTVNGTDQNDTITPTISSMNETTTIDNVTEVASSTQAGDQKLTGFERKFDKFDDEVGVYYGSGYRLVTCRVKKCAHEFVELAYENTTARKICDASIPGATFKLQNTIWAPWECRYGNETASMDKRNVRFCHDKSSYCENETMCSGSFHYCVVVFNGSADQETARTCSLVPPGPGHCPDRTNDPRIPASIFCGDGSPTLCEALASAGQGGALPYAELFGEEVCAPDFEHIHFRDEPRFYNEPLEIDRYNRHLGIGCSNRTHGHGLAVNCAIKENTSVVATKHHFPRCVGAINMTISDLVLDGGPRVYKLVCIFGAGANITARLANYLVVTDASLNITLADEGLLCALDPKESEEFVVSYWWTEVGTMNKIQDGPILKRPINDSSQYECHASLVYKTCSPHRRFEKIFHAVFGNRTNGTVDTSSSIPAASTTATSTVTDGKESSAQTATTGEPSTSPTTSNATAEEESSTPTMGTVTAGEESSTPMTTTVSAGELSTTPTTNTVSAQEESSTPTMSTVTAGGETTTPTTTTVTAGGKSSTPPAPTLSRYPTTSGPNIKQSTTSPAAAIYRQTWGAQITLLVSVLWTMTALLD